MAGKLSSQIAESSEPTGLGRGIRLQEQKRAREEAELRRLEFERLKKQASDVKASQFSGIKSLGEYRTKYEQLPPEIQQFFSTPTELETQQKVQIETNLKKTDERIKNYQAKIERTRQQLREYQEWWQRLSSSERSRRRDSYDRRTQEYEDDIDKYQDYVTEWNNIRGKVSEGVDFGDAGNYVENRIDYLQAKQDQRREIQKRQKEIEKRQKEIDKKIAQGYSIDSVEIFKDGKIQEIKDYIVSPSGKWELVNTRKGADIKNASPSKLGKITVQTPFTVGGKYYVEGKGFVDKLQSGDKYKVFQSIQPLYVGGGGKLVTPIANLGKTEEQYISEKNIELAKKNLAIDKDTGEVTLSPSVLERARQYDIENRPVDDTPKGKEKWTKTLNKFIDTTATPLFRPITSRYDVELGGKYGVKIVPQADLVAPEGKGWYSSVQAGMKNSLLWDEGFRDIINVGTGIGFLKIFDYQVSSDTRDTMDKFWTSGVKNPKGTTITNIGGRELETPLILSTTPDYNTQGTMSGTIKFNANGDPVFVEEKRTNVQLTPVVKERHGTFLPLINPVDQYRYQQEEKDLAKLYKEGNKLVEDWEKIEKTPEELEKLPEEEQANYYFELAKIQEQPALKEIKDIQKQGKVQSYFQDISDETKYRKATGQSGAWQGYAMQGSIRVLQVVPYFTLARFVEAETQIVEGTAKIFEVDAETTKSEKLSGGLQAGFGALIFAEAGYSKYLKGWSGKSIDKLVKAENWAGIEGGIGQRLSAFASSKTGRVLSVTSKVGTKVAIPVAIGGAVGYYNWKLTDDVMTGIVTGVAVGGAIGGYMGYKALKSWRKVGLVDIKKDVALTGRTARGTKFNPSKAELIELKRAGKLSKGVVAKFTKKGWFTTKEFRVGEMTGKQEAKITKLLLEQGRYDPQTISKALKLRYNPHVVTGRPQRATAVFKKTASKSELKRFEIFEDKFMEEANNVINDAGFKEPYVSGKKAGVYVQQPNIMEITYPDWVEKLPYGLRGTPVLSTKPVFTGELVFQSGKEFFRYSADAVKFRGSDRSYGYSKVGDKVEWRVNTLRTTKNLLKYKPFKFQQIKNELLFEKSIGNTKLTKRLIETKIMEGEVGYSKKMTGKQIWNELRQGKVGGVFKAGKTTNLRSVETILSRKGQPYPKIDVEARVVDNYMRGIITKSINVDIGGIQATKSYVFDPLKEQISSKKTPKTSVNRAMKDLTGDTIARTTEGSSRQAVDQVKKVITQQGLMSQTQVQAPTNVQSSVPKIKSKLDIGSSSVSLSKAIQSTGLTNQLRNLSKQNMDVENILKSQNKLELNQRNMVSQVSAQKQNQKQLQKQLQMQLQAQAVTSIASPQFSPNLNMNIKEPTLNIPPIFWLPEFDGLKARVRRKKKRQNKGMSAYLPDFTSRVIGLAPQEVTQAQAQKLLKQQLTGLEIRRGAKIKW